MNEKNQQSSRTVGEDLKPAEDKEAARVALENSAVFANQFYLVANSQQVRIAFMERALAGAPTIFQNATVLNRAEAIDLHQKLGQILMMSEDKPASVMMN